ncbi:MAG: NfeD family protein [Bacteroidota bacterium]
MIDSHRHSIGPLLLIVLMTSLSFVPTLSDAQTLDSTQVYVGRVEGAIGPTVAQYIGRVISTGTQNNAELVIIELDTPGGLLDATQDIVQTLLASKTPVAVYVSPEGASAGSAGVFITLAAHVAAMAPATNIGAASPVSMGGSGAQMDTVMQKKLFNYSESYIETIAQHRNRNVEWAKSAVRDAKSITADEALKLNVIDLIASHRSDLLNQLDGAVIENDTLHTSQASITEISESFTETFFRFLFQPQIILILTLIAIYGIVGELTNPGAIIPGISGAIALILLLYTVAAMPVNVAGFALIGLAIILFIAEAFTPTFGLLIVGGGVSFALGLMMLFQEMTPTFQLSWWWILPATFLTMAFFAVIVFFGIKAQFNDIKVGTETLIGQEAEVVDAISDHQGRVFVNGEYWNARSRQPIEKGSYCRVTAVRGLELTVTPIHPQEEETL